MGERWALLVVRELLLGPKRFTDLRGGLPHLSPDVLTQRLRDLEHAAVVRRRRLAPPASAWVYELTEWGRDLEPAVLALARWGSRAPFPRGDAGIGVDSVVLALKTLFDPGAADDLDASYELRLGEERFHVRVAGRRLELARGEPADPDAIIATDPGTLSAVLWHDEPLAAAQRSGRLEVEGNRSAARRWLGLFPAPRPAASA